MLLNGINDIAVISNDVVALGDFIERSSTRRWDRLAAMARAKP